MAVDVVMVSLCVLNDPYPIPPSAMAFLMVVLGNGMRFGLRIFRETLALSIGAFACATWVRTVYGNWPITTGSMFFVAFWVVIVLYAYMLTRRIDEQRHALDLRSRLDSLTGLLNRHGLSLAAERAFAQVRDGAGLTAMYLDLDRFKQVNDTHGHAVGDWVLAEFGDLLGKVAGENLAARIGGDEFVLLAHDLPRDEAQLLAE
jgi:predicted signal transduction protein with EAL and GGDEF domain